MKNALLVGFGGFLGAVARYQLGGAVLRLSSGWKFPLGTFVVNVLGCLAAGVLAGYIAKFDSFSVEARIFLFTGLLGGFTTFSAFGLETVILFQRRDIVPAILNVVLSVSAGLAALWLGMKAAT